MGGWFGGGGSVQVPAPVAPVAEKADAQAAGNAAKVEKKSTTMLSRLAGRGGATAFGGKATELGGAATGQGQSQFANMARKALLGE